MRDIKLTSLEEQLEIHEHEAKQLRKCVRERRNFLRKLREFNELINSIQHDVDPEAFAAEHGLSVETVLAWHKKAVQKRDAVALERRNREIRRLANSGMTNKELGFRFRLHPNSVGRILNRAQRELTPRKMPIVPYWKYRLGIED
ncbi:hypothetical protein PsW64_03813 [Pseudovibrio sp. W64]|uniref:hypothetical protein n=1 Tax=Pseudovibrio sp. W64 TaxID=1735583 RepID=UPI0007AE7A85|nr:hypothetical protein [Pseudovibrio sp. W64]KZK78174.1 hypothetical protein PsW64_03813 [Pseudovibrio sp. W64]